MRAFISIPLNENTKKEIMRIISESENKLSNKHNEKLNYINWTRPENLHITLKFLGDLKEKEVATIMELLRGIRFKRFTCTLRNIGFLPNKKRVRVIYIAVDPSNIIKQLHDLLNNQINTFLNTKEKTSINTDSKYINLKHTSNRLATCLNFEKYEHKDFISHITIARIKDKNIKKNKENIQKMKDLLDYIKKIQVNPVNFQVESFELNKSTLTEKGPIYEKIEEFKLI